MCTVDEQPTLKKKDSTTKFFGRHGKAHCINVIDYPTEMSTRPPKNQSRMVGVLKKSVFALIATRLFSRQ